MSKIKTISYVAGTGLLLAGAYHFIKKEMASGKVKGNCRKFYNEDEIDSINTSERVYHDLTEIYQKSKKHVG